MAEKWKPTSPEILKSWIGALGDESSDELSDWEIKFITDMNDRLKWGIVLTQSQEEKLEEIYAEKTK
jgi:hypothetical protein